MFARLTRNLCVHLCGCVGNGSHTLSFHSYSHVDPVIKVDHSHVRIHRVCYNPADSSQALELFAHLSG